MNKQDFWQSVLSELEVLISKANFTTWFKNTSLKKKKSNKIIVAVPNAFTREWLENKYHKLILKAINKSSPQVKHVEYVIDRQNQSSHSKPQKSPWKNKQKQPISTNESSSNSNHSLNPEYTFDHFVVGPSNELAQATCLAATKKPGRTYNPIFIYGGVGLGKTHLLQAVGHKIADTSDPKKICYTSSEKFTNKLIESIRNHSMKKFKDHYRNFDCLIIDDIQFIGGKEKTQEEFFHTFNSLYERNKQIILSSDRPPKAIHTLEERLRSRFAGGVIADINQPEFETRLAILQNKIKNKNASLDSETLEYIASKVTNNVRELEGALNRLIAYSQINNTALDDKKKINHILSSFFQKPKTKKMNTKDIIKAVGEFYNIKPKEIKARKRQREIVKARQIVMYLMREELDSSFPSIGDKIGGRDHTTAIYAYNKIDDLLSENKNLQEELQLIKEQING